MTNSVSGDIFYWNPDKQERVRAVYQVHLVMPATYEGYVDIEAESEEEAARLALEDHFSEVDWCDVERGDGCCEVFEVFCENPPADAILIRPGRRTGANLDALFEPEPQPTATEEQSQAKGELSAKALSEVRERALVLLRDLMAKKGITSLADIV